MCVLGGIGSHIDGLVTGGRMRHTVERAVTIRRTVAKGRVGGIAAWLACYLHMPIGMAGIYRLLFVFVCVYVCVSAKLW